MEDIGPAVPAFAELAEQVETQFPGASDRVRFWEIQRQLMGILVGGLIEGTIAAAAYSGRRDDGRRSRARLSAG